MTKFNTQITVELIPSLWGDSSPLVLKSHCILYVQDAACAREQTSGTGKVVSQSELAPGVRQLVHGEDQLASSSMDRKLTADHPAET